jgi:HTH-type transcriptional regulator/antitoxin HigA
MTALDEIRYAELLKDKHPRVIRTEQENERALHEVEDLMSRGEQLRAEEAELLELLAILIERFEEERYALDPAPPLDVLRELMAARAMTQTEISRLFPSKGIASEVLTGKREISKAQAQKLGNFFHVPAAIFLGI